jgi:hypothetical protein
MAANISARKLQLEALGAPAASYAHCFISVECAGQDCQKGRTFPVEGFAGVFPGLTLGEILKRMRCQTCGGPLVSARLLTGPPGRKGSRWVELIGQPAQGPRRD